MATSKSGAGNSMTRQQIQEKIVALAWKDADFRKKFIADPKKQFEERLGVKLPAGLKITAHAEDENHLFFVIPKKPTGELTDKQLEKVAGGGSPDYSGTGMQIIDQTLTAVIRAW